MFIAFYLDANCNKYFGILLLKLFSLSGPVGWALNPMIERVTELPPKINLSFIYGSRSWIDREPAYDIKEMLLDRSVTIDVIQGAGHHVYADNVGKFNQLVNSICKCVDDCNQ